MVKDVLDSGKYCIRAEKNGIWSNPVYVETSISAANLTITTYGANKVYDGQPLTDGTANGFIDGLRGSDRAKIVCTGEQIQFGESYNTYDILWDDEDLKKNYTITSSLGLLVVGKRTVEIDWGTLEFAYAEGISQGPSPQIRNKVAGDGVSLTFDGTLSAEAAGTYSISIIGISGDDAANYELPSTSITKTWRIIEGDIAATILFAEDFTYDGTSHDLVSVTVTNPADPNDYAVLYSVNDGGYTTTVPSVSDAGTYVVKAKINATINGVDKERPEEVATITMAPKAIDDSMHITGIGSAYTYAGEDITPVPSITWNGNVVRLDTDYTVGYSDNRNVGVAKVTMTGKGNYTGSLTKEFTIEPKAVTVKANDASKTYGDTDPTLTAEVTGLLGEDTIDYTVTRVAGDNVEEYTITASGAAEQGNYTVSYETGKFTIEKAPLTVTADNKTITYGDAVPVYTYKITGFVNKETDSVVTGTPTLSCAYAQYDKVDDYAISVDVAGMSAVNYKFEAGSDVALTVEQKEVTVTWGSYTPFVYDATVHTVEAAIGVVNSDAVTFVYENNSAVAAGNYVATITGLSGDKAGNYKLPADGLTLGWEITSAGKITIIAASESRPYNGSALTNDGYTYTEGVIVDGDVLTAVVEGTITNVGTADNVVTSYKVMRGETDVTANYTFGTSVDGTLEITKAPLTVTADNKTITYGDAVPVYTYKITGFVNKETDSVVTGTPTLSCAYAQYDKVDDYAISVDVAGMSAVNYKFEAGSDVALTVKKAPLTVTVNGITGSKVYNGLVQTISGYTLAYTDATGKFSDDAVTGSLTVSGTDAGEYTASAEGFVNNNGNFDVTFVAGDKIALDIVKKAITVTAIDGFKIFGDVDPVYGSDIDGLVEGDSIVYTVVRSYGEAYGSYDLTFIGEEDQGNYTVTYIPGIFQILRKDVLVTADTLEKFYGENDPILSATIVGVIDDVLIDFTIYRDSGEDVGTYGIHIYGDAVQGNYNVYFEDSVLTINAPETVTVTIKMVDASGDVLGMSTERYDVGSTVTIILPVPEGYYLLQDRVTVEVTEALVITVKCFTFEEFVDIQEANAEPDNSIVIDHANARLDEQLSGFTWYAPIIVGLLCVVLFLAIGFRSGYSEMRKKF